MPDADDSGVVVIENPVDEAAEIGVSRLQIHAGNNGSVAYLFQLFIEEEGQVLIELGFLFFDNDADDVVLLLAFFAVSVEDRIVIFARGFEDMAARFVADSVTCGGVAQDGGNDSLCHPGFGGDLLLGYLSAFGHTIHHPLLGISIDNNISNLEKNQIGSKKIFAKNHTETPLGGSAKRRKIPLAGFGGRVKRT